MKLVRIMLGFAVAPWLVLGVLFLLGARHDVGVVTSGAGENAMLGAAWVAVWLGGVIVSPITTLSALVYVLLQKITRAPCRREQEPASGLVRAGW